MKIKKTFQTTVPTGKVLNNRTESNVDTYSCDYINGIETYSTDEVRIGTWLGKPLYRKVLEMTTPATANTWADTGVIITGDFLGVGLGYVNAENEQYPMKGQSAVYFYHKKDNDKLLIQCTDYYKSREIKVTIEYTKTTD